jgi:hypothetical protein
MNEPIENKAPKPLGLVPKNVQSWILIGLAVMMILIMWLTGGRKPRPAAKAPTEAPPAEAQLEVNEAQINQLQSRIAELQRRQAVAQNALAQQTRLLGATTQNSQPTQQQLPASGNPSADPADDAFRSERKKREYLSLFASNVALSYRTSPSTASSAPELRSSLPTPISQPDSSDVAQLAQFKQFEPEALQTPPQVVSRISRAPEPASPGAAGKEEAQP